MNRLKDLRNDKDLTQKQIGKMLGVADNSYSRYESEIINISIEQLKKLSNFYNLSIDYILFRTDNRCPYIKNINNKPNKNKLKELRLSKKKTQKQLALELNMPFRTYLKYENNTRPLNTLILNIFADYYKTSIDYIINDTEEITPHKKSIVDWKIR